MNEFNISAHSRYGGYGGRSLSTRHDKVVSNNDAAVQNMSSYEHNPAITFDITDDKEDDKMVS